MLLAGPPGTGKVEHRYKVVKSVKLGLVFSDQ